MKHSEGYLVTNLNHLGNRPLLIVQLLAMLRRLLPAITAMMTLTGLPLLPILTQQLILKASIMIFWAIASQLACVTAAATIMMLIR